MTVGKAFRKLTRMLRRIERSDWSVTAVAPERGGAFETGDSLSANVRCVRTGSPAGSSRNDETGRQAPLAAPDILAEIRELSEDVDVRTDNIQTGSQGGTVLHLTVEVSLTGSTPEHAEVSANGAPPLHRDRTRLAQLYDTYSTFTEMAAAVDGTVSEETIRRYMIEHEIHDPEGATPSPYSSTESDESPFAIEHAAIPDDIDHDALVRAVVESKTVREVSNWLELDRQSTVSLLSDVGLLEHVTGSIRTASERNISESEVRAQLQHAS